jgi:TrmH family RNA methyltransferase
MIRSRDNKWLKQFRAALRGSGPESGEPIALEGPNLVEEGLHAGLEPEALLVSETGERELGRILNAASQSETGIPRQRVLRTTDQLFGTVAGTESPQGVAALFRQREWAFEDLLRGIASADGAFRGDAPLVMVLVGVQDPGNVGTVIRSSEAFCATGVIATRGTAHPWSPKAVRASAGSALRLPLLRGIAAPVAIAQLRVAGVKIYAAATRACTDDRGEPKTSRKLIDTSALREAAAVFIGSEGHGLPPEVEHSADGTISIPISQTVESLNAAIAASILLYEASRQRRPEPNA